MATSTPEAPTTTTGELALPITSGDMLGRLTLASEVAPAPRSPHHASASRRETFVSPRREAVLMWTATGALGLAALALAGAIITG